MADETQNDARPPRLFVLFWRRSGREYARPKDKTSNTCAPRAPILRYWECQEAEDTIAKCQHRLFCDIIVLSLAPDLFILRTTVHKKFLTTETTETGKLNHKTTS